MNNYTEEQLADIRECIDEIREILSNMLKKSTPD